MKKKIFTLLFGLLCIFMISGSDLYAEDNRVVRVGYPIQEGLTQIDENGKYSGYTYDYLMEIAKYTNWKYEFVQAEGTLNEQLMTLLPMLENGEIDLMGAMSYSDQLAARLDYASYNYGTTYEVLRVLEDNEQINSTNYYTLDVLRVAVYSPSGKPDKALEEFAVSSGCQIEQIMCSSEEEQLAALKNNAADAMQSVGVQPAQEGMRTIVQFNPKPFYFAASKGKQSIANEVNSAISNINSFNPYFATQLKEKYFNEGGGDLFLSQDEKAYIEQRGEITVAMLAGQAPVCYYDDRAGKPAGVAVDVLDFISDHTGLKFNYRMTDSYEEYKKWINGGSMPILAMASDNKELTEYDSYNLSTPYITTPIVITMRKDINPDNLEGKKLALVKGYTYDGEYKGAPAYYDNIEECIDAIRDKNADYCYGNRYSVQYYLSGPYHNDLVTYLQSDEWQQQFCLGVSKSEDVKLFSIINKSVRDAVTEGGIESYLYTNAYQQGEFSVLKYLKSHREYVVIAAVLLGLSVVIIALVRYSGKNKKKAKLQQLENQRYEQVSELSNEYWYEYDNLNDVIRFPEKAARFLGYEKEIAHLEQQFQSLTEPQKEENLLCNIVSCQEGSQESCFKLNDGTNIWLRVVSKALKDEDGRTIRIVGKIVDIHEERIKQQALILRARQDSMTGLYNASFSRSLVEKALANSTRDRKGAFMIVDLDYFKNINDTYGHVTGDEVLKEFAHTLQSVAGKEDIVGRLGGDEFMIFIIQACRQERKMTEELCGRLLGRVRDIKVHGKAGVITLSIGVAFADHFHNFEELYRQADKALYEVKGKGRNGYKIAEE